MKTKNRSRWAILKALFTDKYVTEAELGVSVQMIVCGYLLSITCLLVSLYFAW